MGDSGSRWLGVDGLDRSRRERRQRSSRSPSPGAEVVADHMNPLELIALAGPQRPTYRAHERDREHHAASSRAPIDPTVVASASPLSADEFFITPDASHPKFTPYVRGRHSAADDAFARVAAVEERKRERAEASEANLLGRFTPAAPPDELEMSPLQRSFAAIDAAHSDDEDDANEHEQADSQPQVPDGPISTPVDRPSSFHAVMHFLLRLLSLICLLICALVRTNVWGFCFLILFFFGLGVLAFSRGDRTASGRPRPGIASLTPFVGPGFVITFAGLLSMAVIQLVRRFTSGTDGPLADGSLLRQFGMSYTEDATSANIAVLFAPFLAGLVFFAVCIAYMRWHRRAVAIERRTVSERDAAEKAVLDEFRRTHLDEPIRRLDAVVAKSATDADVQLTPDQKRMLESQLHAKYADLLTAFLKESKSSRRAHAALHRASVRWAWFEVKVCHPLLHLLAFSLLLMAGLLERSVLSYVYYFLWSVTLTKWSLWDRPPPAATEEDERTEAIRAPTRDPMHDMDIGMIEMGMRPMASHAAPLAVDRVSVASDMHPLPISDRAAAPLMSLFSEFPTSASFPRIAASLPIFRLYGFVWVYATLHLMLKYVFRFIFIFDHTTDAPYLRDLTSPDGVRDNHLLFFLGEYSLPTSMDGSDTFHLEEGFHIAILLALNIFLALLMHLARRPHVFLPIVVGTKIFGTPVDGEPDKAATAASARPFTERERARQERTAARAQLRKRRAQARAEARAEKRRVSALNDPLPPSASPPIGASAQPSARASSASPSSGARSVSPSVVSQRPFDEMDSPPPILSGADELTTFQRLGAFVGRSLWLLLPAACFMLAILYTSYPGLAFLVAMFLATFFSIGVSFQLLPVLVLYTQGINHTYYVFHLVNSYWDDEDGAHYLSEIHISTLVSFILSSVAVAYFAFAHRYAHRAILYWECVHGFARGQLISGANPLGLLSPRLGHHEIVMRRHGKLVRAQLKSWREEDERRAREARAERQRLERNAAEFVRRQQARRARMTPEQIRAEEEEAAVAHVLSPQRVDIFAASPSRATRRILPATRPAPHEERKTQSPPDALPSTPLAAAAATPSNPFRVVVHGLDGSSTALSLKSNAFMDAASTAYTAAANAHARRRIKEHFGFPSEEACAAALIQAAFRGRKARQALEASGLHVTLPEEHIELQRQHHSHHHHHHQSSARSKESSSTRPSFLRRSLRWLGSSFVMCSLSLCSYSNMLLMVLLYVVGILRADIIHGVYMALFLLHAISPWMRRHHGIVVVWSSLVIIAEYLWGLHDFHDNSDLNDDWTNRIGLIDMGRFNQDLFPHVAVLVLSGCFHRFAPEEAAQAQIHLHEMDEKAAAAAANGSSPSASPEEVDAELTADDLNRRAYASYWFSPYGPFFRSIVTCGLLVCTGVTLWAGLVNSLMTNSTVSADPNDTIGDIGVSVISGIYLLFVFALLLIHQLRPGMRAYKPDRVLLFLLSIYAGGVVILQYVYQFGVLDDSMERLNERTSYRFGPAEIGIFKGSLAQSLLSHSIVLFVCVAQLRILVMDDDPATGKSISRACSPGGTIEAVLEQIDEVLNASEERLREFDDKRVEARRQRVEEKARAASLQKDRMAAFEAGEFGRLQHEFDADFDQKQDAKRQKRLAKKRQRSAAAAASVASLETSMQRRSFAMTLLVHFFARLAYQIVLFCDWFLLQHADKALALTLFFAAITHVSIMGAWYILLAFGTLLVLGYPRVKALAAIISSQIFILVCFLWQFPADAFDQSAVIFSIIGLNKDSSFGRVALHHIAVMMVACLYGAANFWLRVHQRKTMVQSQLEDFESYQERAMQQRREMEMNQVDEAQVDDQTAVGVAPTPVLDEDQLAAADLLEHQAAVQAAAASTVAGLLNQPEQSSMTSAASSSRPAALPTLQVSSPSPTAPTTVFALPEPAMLHATSPLRLTQASSEVMPALLSTLPSPGPPASEHIGTSAAYPRTLTREQHSAAVLYNHLQSRLYHDQWTAEHKHPSSLRDADIQDLQNMNLDVLMQNNVGPAERRGRPRYQPAALATGISEEEPQLSPSDRTSGMSNDTSAPGIGAAPLMSAQDPTGEASDDEDSPLRNVQSWMMAVPLAENSHRLSRERKLEQRRRAEKKQTQAAQREAGSSNQLPASPRDLNDESRRFDLASSATTAGLSDANALEGDGGSHMNHSFLHRFFRGLLGDDGFFVFCGRAAHYFGLFHLALLALLAAAESNASTIFSLYYVAVAGVLSGVGTQTANRHWHALVGTLTICIAGKYGLALANHSPSYACGTRSDGTPDCSRWLIWLAKDTHLYYWDATAWLLVVIHFSFLRVRARVESQMAERRRMEREEPWELKSGGGAHNPLEQAACEAASEGAVETFHVHHVEGGDAADPNSQSAPASSYHRFTPIVHFPPLSLRAPLVARIKRKYSLAGEGSNDLPGLLPPSPDIESQSARPPLRLPSGLSLQPTETKHALLSPSGFPSYAETLNSSEPVPTSIAITYTTVTNQLSSYLVPNFMRGAGRSVNSAHYSVSDYLHFLVFRGGHFLLLLVIMAVATTYFNLISFAYFAFCLAILWQGDRVIDGAQMRMWDQLYLFVYVVICLRLLYQLPIFHLSSIATSWSTVFGFYKSTLDDCTYSSGGSASCSVTSFTGLVPRALVLDIVIFAGVLVVRTLLARKEMVFVRHDLREQRAVAVIRAELISLQLEADRLQRVYDDRREAIRRLQRVTELKEIKLRRELRLHEERVASGQLEIIAAWESAGLAMGIPASKKPPGEDEHAMARASIRNHAINRLKATRGVLTGASMGASEPTLPPPPTPRAGVPLSRSLDDPRSRTSSRGSTPRRSTQNRPGLKRSSSDLSVHETLHEHDAEEIEDELEHIGKLGSRQTSGKGDQAPAATQEHEMAQPVTGSSSDSDSVPLLDRPGAKRSTRPAAGQHRRRASSSEATTADVQPSLEEDPAALLASLRATVFEQRIIRDRMSKLRRKRAQHRLDHEDDTPLLLLKLTEHRWMRAMRAAFHSGKSSIFRTDEAERFVSPDSVIDVDQHETADTATTDADAADKNGQPAADKLAAAAPSVEPTSTTVTIIDPAAAQTTVMTHTASSTSDKKSGPMPRSASWSRGGYSPAEISTTVPSPVSSRSIARDTSTATQSAANERHIVIAAPEAADLSSQPSTPAPTSSVRPMSSVLSDASDDDDDDLPPEPSLPAQVWELLVALIVGNSLALVCFFFILEFLVQPSLLTLIYPISLFLYGLMVYPRPPRRFWSTLLAYTTLLLMLRFLFQLPCFCVCDTIYGESYSLCSLSNTESCSLTSYSAISSSTTSLQDIIGLKKLVSRDHAQRGRFMKFVGGALLDFFTLFAIALHRRSLRVQGLWLSEDEIDTRRRQHRHIVSKKVKAALRQADNKTGTNNKSHSRRAHRPDSFSADGFERQVSLSSTQFPPPSLRRSVSEEVTAMHTATDPESVLIDVGSLRTKQLRHAESDSSPMTGSSRTRAQWSKEQRDRGSRTIAKSGSGTNAKPFKKRNHTALAAPATSPRATKPRRDPRSASADLSRASSSGDLASSSPRHRKKRSLLDRMSRMLSAGKLKFLHAIGESSSNTTPAVSDNEEIEDGRLGEREGLLADATSVHHARTAKEMRKLERARIRARTKLAKQVASDREARLQRHLRRLTQAERQAALQEAIEIKSKEDARERRHQARMRERMAARERARAAHRPPPTPSWPIRFWEYLTSTIGDPGHKAGRDFYIYTFLVQLLQFLIIVIFYNLNDSAGSLTQNYISPQFVLAIFAQFVHIVLERVVYLYRNLLFKAMLQLASIITFFIIALYVGLRGNAFISTIYCLMCIYWVLSSLQFYYGYPSSTQGQFLAKSTHRLPSTLFTLYRAIPFVFELRTLLDWICTDTVLSFGEWLKLEDIYAMFFLAQCNCDRKRNSPKRAGTQQRWWVKLLVGFGLFLVLLFIVWGPLFLFSSQAATSTNSVLSTHVTVDVPGYATLYSSDQTYIVASDGSTGDQTLSSDEYAQLVASHSFLSSQRQRDLQIIYPLGDAAGVWSITPAARSSLITHLADATTTRTLDFTFSFTRSPKTTAPNTYYTYQYALDDTMLAAMVQMVNDTATTGASNSSLLLPSCYPAFFFMSSTLSSGAIEVLSTSATTGMVNCRLSLQQGTDAFGVEQEWWVIGDAGSFGSVPSSDTGVMLPSETFATSYTGGTIGPPIFMYSGEIPSGSTLNYGLVGVYVTVVLAIGRFLRMYVMGTSKSIQWDDMQDALPVLNMCRDLYTARLHHQLKLEQQLYVELINLLRSPETLLMRTGEFIHYWPKDTSDEESDETGSDDDFTDDESSSGDSDDDSDATSDEENGKRRP